MHFRHGCVFDHVFYIRKRLLFAYTGVCLETVGKRFHIVQNSHIAAGEEEIFSLSQVGINTSLYYPSRHFISFIHFVNIFFSAKSVSVSLTCLRSGKKKSKTPHKGKNSSRALSYRVTAFKPVAADRTAVF